MSLRKPNPVLSRSFNGQQDRSPFAPMPQSQPQVSGETPVSGTGVAMTMEGTVNKTVMLLAVLSLAAAFPYFGPAAVTSALMALYLPLAFLTVGIAVGVAFRPHLASRLAVAYAAIQGLMLGTITRVLDVSYPGIANQALILTVGVAAAMLFLYRARIVKVTQNFRIAVTAATLGVFVVYLVSLVGRLFGFEVPLLHENSAAGIAVSLVIVGLAAANLALDFDFVEHGVESKMPAHYEWVGAFGLVVTLAWLYVEILRLLAKLRSRD
jgi:uncharacterized YccA/Bax inhibitor family protein